jgi:hypothetical protein
MRIKRMLAMSAGALLVAVALAVAGPPGTANADTPNAAIGTVVGSIGGLFTGIKCLDLNAGDGLDVPNSRIDQWDCHGGNNQQFHWHPYAFVSTPLLPRWIYQLVNLRSKQCVEVRDGLVRNETQIDQFPCATSGAVDSQTSRQLWLVTRVNLTHYFIFQPWNALSAGANMCMDVQGGQNDNGVKIQEYTCNSSSAQEFYGDEIPDDGVVVHRPGA